MLAKGRRRRVSKAVVASKTTPPSSPAAAKLVKVMKNSHKKEEEDSTVLFAANRSTHEHKNAHFHSKCETGWVFLSVCDIRAATNSKQRARTWLNVSSRTRGILWRKTELGYVDR